MSKTIFVTLTILLVGMNAYGESEEFRKKLAEAETGNAGALLIVGRAYYKGEGVQQDYKKAFECFVRAARKGKVKALYNLGMMYRKGEGVPQNNGQAFKCYTMAAQKGMAEAQLALGFMYWNGKGIRKNEQKAFKWWIKAAEQDNTGAQIALGVNLMPKNSKEAFKWFRKAIPENDKEYANILIKAAEHGNDENKKEMINYFVNRYLERGVTHLESWVPLAEWSNISYNKNYKYHPDEMKLSNGMLLRRANWDNLLKSYVESFPIEQRNDILEGLTRFWVGYDEVDKIIKFEPLRYISGPYGSKSYISFKGRLEKNRAFALVELKYYGESWIFADRIKVVIDDNYTWESPNIEFYRDNTSSVWEYTFLNIESLEIRKMIKKIISSNKTIIRFIGQQYYSDFEVTKRMKTDMAAILKTIDLVNGN